MQEFFPSTKNAYIEKCERNMERMVQPMDKPHSTGFFHRFIRHTLINIHLPLVQAKVAHNIMNCKTGAYGAK